jgi:5-methylcytosine-specific restriction endonuclease McrA
MADPVGGLAERLLALLDQAAVATTYKYALLLALIDSSLDGTNANGEPPDRIEVQRLAEHVLTLYWPHADPYPGTGEVLRQSGTGQAELLTQIRRFRLRDPAARSTLAAARYSDEYPRLLASTSWKLAEMPLPRLQRIGNVTDPFLYEIGWDEQVSRRTFEGAAFDRSVHLKPMVGRELIRLAPLLRPLIERLWASRVIVYNRLPEGQIDEFLFRRSRLDAVRLRLALFELQDGRCFYTDRPMRPVDADVDHFVPWSRSPLNAIENLVVADRRVNNNKRDHLAAAEHVVRWRARNRALGDELVRVAATNSWETAHAETVGVARALYLVLDSNNLLWSAPNEFVYADVLTLQAALAA